jgi:IS605 OrfB family transposase
MVLGRMVCMPRHTSFRFLLDPSVEQERVLSRHVGAARFAFNQALRLHEDAYAAAGCKHTPGIGTGSSGEQPVDDGDPDVRVPWSGFDLINAFNAWKRSEAAGRRFLVDTAGRTRVQVTGLVWRDQVLAQVFEEAAVDLARGLKAAMDSLTGARKGPKARLPRFKKSATGGSFRIRNKTNKGRSSIRVGDGERVRLRLRRLSKAVTRKKKGSKNRKKAVVRLSRQHARIRDRRRHMLHQVSNQLVKNHARLVLEDLNITGMRSNRKLSRAISDAAWGELARQVTYKQAWRGGQVLLADRWFPSSKTCSTCGTLRKDLTVKDRVFECRSCGHVVDRDLNAAVNLAAWAENHTLTIPADTAAEGGGRGAARVGDRQAAGPVNNAYRQNAPTQHTPSGRVGRDWTT